MIGCKKREYIIGIISRVHRRFIRQGIWNFTNPCSLQFASVTVIAIESSSRQNYSNQRNDCCYSPVLLLELKAFYSLEREIRVKSLRLQAGQLGDQPRLVSLMARKAESEGRRDWGNMELLRVPVIVHAMQSSFTHPQRESTVFSQPSASGQNE
jgi:hypothetical protein